MAAANQAVRVWTSFEDDFLIHWFCQAIRESPPKGTTNSLLLVSKFHDLVNHDASIITNITESDIVRKLMDLKNEFHNFKDFLKERGIILTDGRDVISPGLDCFVIVIADDNDRGANISLSGLRNFSKLRFLFMNGGYLDGVDFDWLMDIVSGTMIEGTSDSGLEDKGEETEK